MKRIGHFDPDIKAPFLLFFLPKHYYSSIMHYIHPLYYHDITATKLLYPLYYHDITATKLLYPLYYHDITATKLVLNSNIIRVF